MTFATRSALAVTLATAFSLAPGCASDGAQGSTEPQCLDHPGPLECDALYGLYNGEIAPTYDDVFQNTLVKHCGNSTACHAGSQPQAGLKLDDESTAYAELTGIGTNGKPRMTPGDIQCGRMIVRIETEGAAYSMPPGPDGHLSATELCSIRNWIKNGAPQ